MADTTEPLLQECATCGTLIDVSDEEPFALMHCPNCGAAMRVRRQFGNFELQEILGAGGMGAVYRALDTTLNRSVALKLLRKEFTEDPEFVRQFEHEASITALINHPNVVKVYSTASDHGLYYITMELVDKGSLDDLMNLQGRVAEAQVLDVGIQIAQGLAAAIRRKLIHRDVKPGNILFADAHHAKIVDFGLARPMDQAHEVGAEIWGTPYYVAPEKLDSPPKEDLRSDIYSLGATLFHAVAGRPPYEAKDASMVALKHLKSQPVSLQAFAPDVSNATNYVINRTLLKEPDERYATYEELIEHLEYARSQLHLTDSGSRQKARIVLEDERSQRMMSWMTVGILAALLLGGAALFLFRDKIFGPERSNVQAASEKARDLTAQLGPKFQAAQKLLADGKYGEAASAFDAIEAESELPQPLHNWETLQAGLSRLLDGHREAANADFQKLISRGPYSFDPGEEKLAKFFLDIARATSDPEVQPATVARNYAKTNFESLGLLLLAAKDWMLDDFDDAGPLFRQFHSASPAEPYNWITEYRALAMHYIDAYAAYREVAEQIKSARTLDEQNALKVKFQGALAGGREMKGKLAEKTEALIRDFNQKVADRVEAEAKKITEEKEQETTTLATAKAKMNELFQQYKYAEGKAAIAGINLIGENTKKEQALLEKRADWLVKFKTLLIHDLGTYGYPPPMVRKAGSIIPGGTIIATDADLNVKTQYGSEKIAWADISPESVYAMGRSFIRAGIPPDGLADREWFLGVYAFEIGKAKEGRALVTEAAKNKPEYHDELAAFPEATETP